MPKYQVLREATQTHAVTVVADSPEDAVRKAQAKPLSAWESIDDSSGYSHIDSVTEQRKNGRAFSVEYNHNREPRCVEVRDDETPVDRFERESY